MPLTAAEQFFLELQNRARLDPLAEAARQGIDLNQGLAAGTLTGNSRPVLAANEALNEAAAAHSAWMLATDTFSHTGSGGSSAGLRMETAGYAFVGDWTWGENIAWSGTTGSVNLEAAVSGHHSGLFRSAGHRTNTLNEGFSEIGVGQVGGQFLASGTNWNASMLTTNFARSGSSVFVTGVAYTDSDANNFYSIGEGRGGVSFQIIGGVSVSSEAAGGYALATLAALNTAVRIGHGGLTSDVVVDTSAGNAKLDLVGNSIVLSSVSIALVSGAVTEARLLGLNDLDAAGNGANNRLVGNAGANGLSGGLGADTLEGGAGNDTLMGGAGADRLTGGDGARDRVDYSDAATGLRADLQVASTNTGDAAGDIFSGVEDIFGSALGDSLLGDAAGNMIWGDGGNDIYLDGRLGNDSIYGGTGNDVLIGGWGADVLDGGAGAHDRAQYTDSAGLRVDLQVASTNTGLAAGDSYIGIEDLYGSFQSDSLLGDGGGNLIVGASGNDLIDGRLGNDTLYGGAGNDTLNGGSGADVFVFDTSPGAGNVDSIGPYNAAEDAIWLDDAVFTALTAGALSAAAFASGAAATTAAQRVIYNAATGQLLYDADGNGSGAAVQFATLAPGTGLTAGEFLVI